jgi:hypothetical protein
MSMGRVIDMAADDLMVVVRGRKRGRAEVQVARKVEVLRGLGTDKRRFDELRRWLRDVEHFGARVTPGQSKLLLETFDGDFDRLRAAKALRRLVDDHRWWAGLVPSAFDLPECKRAAGGL